MNQEDSQDWGAIEALLDAALDLPAAQRETHVRAATRDRPRLQERVLALLAAEQAAGDFMETTPPGSAAAADHEEPQDGRVGPWELLELIGRGGMGAVYHAERADGQFRQSAALKLIHDPSPAQIARFETERQILADLNHPNIARLLDGGLRADGTPYMAMELVAGQPLLKAIVSLPVRDRLQLFLDICAAVSYAHRHLVVHRDIKPDNILIDHDGHPKLLDFGIAKLTRQDLEGGQTQALATPNFAAPEQLTGGAITTGTDVYGLGATLYAMLCGEPPLKLDGLSLPQVLDRVMHDEPVPPSARASNPALAGDLDAICAKAMAKERAARYGEVESLAEDIRRHLQQEPVRARPPSFRYRAGRALRRHKLVATAVAATVLSLMAGLAGTAWQAHVAGVERDMARRDAARLSTMRGAMLKVFKTAATSADSASLSARELFRQSAASIERDYADDPATAGALLQMLGALHLFTEDYAQARQVLTQADGYADKGMAPEVLADLRYDQAQLAYRDGDYAAAQTLYDRAAAVWNAAADRYQAELISASTLASQLARTAGRSQQAVEILELAARRAKTHWGTQHPQTGIVLINLAVAHYYNNDLPRALASCERAWEVWRQPGREDSPDALNLLANWGLFALRDGRLVEGERRLADALDLRTRLYGASAAQATLMKNLGIAHRLNGRRGAGMRLLEQAEWMAAEYAGAGGRLHASAAFALAWALQEEGKTGEAIALLHRALAASEDRAFSWRYLNQALLASLQPDARAADFRAAIAGLESLGPAVLNQLADAHWARARWQQRRGDPVGQAESLRQALRDKTRARRPGHHETLLIQAELATALAAADNLSGATALAAATRSRAIEEFGTEHAMTARILALLPTPSPAE